MTQSDTLTNSLIAACCGVGLLFALAQFWLVSKVSVKQSGSSASTSLTAQPLDEGKEYMLEWVSQEIANGAKSFLRAEYRICLIFILVFGLIIFSLISWGQDSTLEGGLTALAFVLGATTSMASGYIGMMVAVFGNVRTTVAAQRGLALSNGGVSMTPNGWTFAFNTAFRSGSVMGFALSSLGLLVLLGLLLVYRTIYEEAEWPIMMEIISGYGLGGSSIAMFGRVGGGIYTKAADVGADLVGKVENAIPEDDPRNPATIADNVGDNVGDVAGMGADLFGSFAESTCAALVLASQCADLNAAGWGALLFPMLVSASGLVVCLVCSFLATTVSPVRNASGVETNLKVQLISTTVLMLPVVYFLAVSFLPAKFEIEGIRDDTLHATNLYSFYCVASGTVGGLIIGLVTEYYTSFSYSPTQEVSESCQTGAATNIIYGLALGYKSAIVPVIVLAVIIWTSFTLCDLYGVALAAVGMLSTLATGLTIDGYGPVCDNAGGIAEMAELQPEVREVTDTLDAAGNTTAAIGKGFAIGSAALVSLALYGAFVVRLNVTSDVDIFTPTIFSFLLIGSMLPYWFSAMTMKSVGLAAMQMVQEVQRQFRENPRLLDASTPDRPDYDACIRISTEASLKEMIAPAALVMLTPLIAGTLFGVQAVFGLLSGGLVSGVQMAISMSNSGGAWDNAKKYIEQDPNARAEKHRYLGVKGEKAHKAAVVGDTVGDPFKDTSGPALNILMKLSAIISLVFAEYFLAINGGHGLIAMMFK
uniref:H(+)-exporting diphosphatase n=1 Tax=Pinguiococcus pyrenoidosus TaxID=172671 RepID=A0A7R9YGC6_9STRA